MSHYDEFREEENQSIRLGKELLTRRNMGIKKYGTSLENAKLTTAALLQHAKEEALDLAEYLQTLIDIETKRRGN